MYQGLWAASLLPAWANVTTSTRAASLAATTLGRPAGPSPTCGTPAMGPQLFGCCPGSRARPTAQPRQGDRLRGPASPRLRPDLLACRRNRSGAHRMVRRHANQLQTLRRLKIQRLGHLRNRPETRHQMPPSSRIAGEKGRPAHIRRLSLWQVACRLPERQGGC